MSGNPVEIMAVKRGGSVGIDINIKNDTATVSDYCQALEDFILEGKYHRIRSKSLTCEGCDICCRERIPLTAVDIIKLKEKVAPDLALRDFLLRYTYIVVAGPAMDITLARDSNEFCIFLNKKTRKCNHYQERPLVCRTYICADSSTRADKLREAVVNTGEDELVRLSLEVAGDRGLLYHEAVDPLVDKRDWPENSWTGKTEYNQVPLKEILSPSLWSELKIKKGE